MEKITRTDNEILERIAELSKANVDRDGIERSRLLEALPFSKAHAFLVHESPHTTDTWERDVRITTRGGVVYALNKNAPDAWLRANQRRTTSAERFLASCCGLLWLIHETDLYEQISEEDHHEYFGKRSLVLVAEYVKANWSVELRGDPINWRELDDDEWIDYDDEGYILPAITADEALGR